MNNFGVIEVASGRTTHAPGWAYVPDSTIPSQSVSSNIAPANRKRAARNNHAGTSTLSSSDLSARHDAKLQKEIDQLNKDSFHRDVAIPIPPKKPGTLAPGRASTIASSSNNKHSTNVRKILVSQKTFANHLDDFEAFRAQAETSAVSTPRVATTPAGTGGARRPIAAATGARKGGSASRSAARTKTPVKAETPTPAPEDADLTMLDAPPAGEDVSQAQPAGDDSVILTPITRPFPTPHPRENDPLLESWLPPLPTDKELRELINAPPLNYNQAKGSWTDDNKRYPRRYFCELCGYWGRVKCNKCGTRVCALDCLDLHRQECFTRYGM